MDIETWRVLAQTDADRRRLPELKTILAGLAAATRQLREAPWNDDASGRHATPREPESK